MTTSDERPAAALTIVEVARWTEGSGTRLAYCPNGDGWVAVDHASAHIWNDERLAWSLPLAGRFVGDVRFATGSRLLLLSPEIVDLEAQTFVDLPPLDVVVTPDTEPPPNPDEFEICGAAFSDDATRLALSVQHRPSRGIGAMSGYEGPRWRLVLAEGQTRTPIDVLFEGEPDAELTPLLIVGEAVVVGGLPVTVWTAGRQVATLDRHTTTVRALAASHDGRRVASAGWDGTVAVWDSASWQPVASWTAHGGEPLSAVAFGHDGTTVATGGADGAVRLWAVNDEPLASGSFEPDADPLAIAVHPDGDRILVALDGGSLVLADVRPQ